MNESRAINGLPSGSVIKNPPALQELQETQEDPLEKELASHSSILAWRLPWTKESGRLQSIESQRIGHDLVTEQQQQEGPVGDSNWKRGRGCLEIPRGIF